MTNRDVFATDPTERDIPNLGVAKVANPEDDGDWATLSGSSVALSARASTSVVSSESSTSFSPSRPERATGGVGERFLRER